MKVVAQDRNGECGRSPFHTDLQRPATCARVASARIAAQFVHTPPPTAPSARKKHRTHFPNQHTFFKEECWRARANKQYNTGVNAAAQYYSFSISARPSKGRNADHKSFEYLTNDTTWDKSVIAV